MTLRWILVCACFWLPLAPLGVRAAAGFTALDLPLGKVWNGAARWADWDNDGDLDLLVMRLGEPGPFPLGAQFWINDSGRLIGQEATNIAGLQNGELAVADFDQDGRLDLAASGEEVSTNGLATGVSLLLQNQGAFRFTPLTAAQASLPSGLVTFGDFDRDGDADVIESNPYPFPGQSGRNVLINLGRGHFEPVTLDTGTAQSPRLTWADLDGNGELDLIATEPQYGARPQVLALRHIEDRRFEPLLMDQPEFSAVFASWADIDGDGDLDVLIQDANVLFPWITFNDGDGRFRKSESPLVAQSVTRVAWGDADNDGDLDVVLCVGGGSHRFALNDGTGHFTTSELPRPIEQQNARPVWGDFDLDGDLDLLITGYCPDEGCTGSLLLRNDSTVANTPPSAPTGLAAATLANGEVQLTWKASTDAQTSQTKLISYDVRIGTSPGGFEIAAPPADPVSGRRRVADFGGERTLLRRVRGLSKGTYYWSVQAVDTAFAGSAWGAESSFIITNTPPIVGEIPDQRVGMSEVKSIEISVDDAESGAAELSMTVESENPGLLPPSRFQLTGSGAIRTLQFQPAPGGLGPVRVSVWVRDPAGLTTHRSFSVTVEEFTAEPLNLPPSATEFALGAESPGDYDGDGDLDLWVSGQRVRTDQTSEFFRALWRNDGQGHFALEEDPSSGATGWVEDFNRDGSLDFLRGDILFLNRGDGTFEEAPTGVPAGPVFPADLNGDGATDVVQYDFIRPLAVYEQHRGHWTPTGPTLDAPVYGPVAVADIDRDGAPDVLAGYFVDLTQATEKTMRLWRNTGTGKLSATPEDIKGFAIAGQGSNWLADYDEDGDLDLVTEVYQNGLEPTFWYAWTNDGRGNFSSNRIDRTYGSLELDLDHDGDLDAYSSFPNPDGSYSWNLLRKETPGVYTPLPVVFSEAPSQVADFDGDGDLDLIAYRKVLNESGVTERRLCLFRNRSDRPNHPPLAPTGLVATRQNGGRVVLAWSPAEDDHTPAHLLTYDLRIGTHPDGFDLVAADPLVARPGNAGNVARRILNNLPAGNYFWSVRSRDGQFRPGPWATEQSFVIDRPAIATIPDLTTQPGQWSRPISIRLTGDSTSSAAELRLSAESEPPELISSNDFRFEGSGAQRTLTFLPGSRGGTASITVTATAPDGRQGNTRFRVEISQFAVTELEPGGSGYDCLTWLDLDADGRLDLAGLSPALDSLTGWHNAGGRLEETPLALAGAKPARFLTGDLNGDNRPDLAVVETGQDPMADPLPSTRLWRGVDATHFLPATPPLTNPASATAALDQDRDGLADFVTWSRREGNNYSPWLTGGFEEGLRLSAPDRAMRLLAGFVWLDLEGDGDLDLVVSGHEAVPGDFWGTSFLRAWKRESNGVLARFETGLPTNLWCRLAAADLNGDGRPELFTGPLDIAGGGGPKLWRNRGDGTFEELQKDFPALLNGPPAWGDFDNDGDLDWVSTSAADLANVNDPSAQPLLWSNDGSGHFQAVSGIFPALMNSDAAWADLDDDGDLDLVLSGAVGWSTPGRRLLRNSSIRTNTPPTPPGGLAPGREPDGLVLAWEPGTDREDVRFVTYNLRVGTTSGGSEIISALADPVSGRRRVGGPGNAGSSRRWRLPNLPNGTYFWAVQTVDAGYAASPFTPEQTFRVSTPQIAGPTSLVLDPNRPAGPFAFSITDLETSAALLDVRVTSEPAALFPPGTAQLRRSGSQWLLTVTPAPHQAGQGTIEITATDAAGEIARVRLTVTVTEELVPVSVPIPPLYQGVAAWADANNDGRLDLIAGGFAGQPYTPGAGRCDLWQNDGGGFARFPLASFNDAGDGAVAVGDPDGDNAVDIAVAGGTGEAQLHWQNSPGRFSPPTMLAPAARSLMAWGDADGDGDSDLVVSGPAEVSFIAYNTTRIYRHGAGRELPAETPNWYGQMLRDGRAQWADFDGDGDADLLLVGNKEYGAGSAASILYFNEGGALQERATGLDPAGSSDAAIADYDLDGDPDVVLTGFRLSSNQVSVATRLYANDGTGHFSAVESPFTGVSAGGAAWGDYDGDGDPDLVISGRTVSNFTTELWVNEGGRFVLSSNHFAGGSARGVAWGDLDQDGDLDLALIGQPEGFSTALPGPGLAAVFRNEINQVAPAPPVPIHPAAEADGNDILLSWQLPDDSRPGLSFNIRVGSSPGASDVMSALADSATGRRLVAGHGNAGWSHHWRLAGQAGRQLYWTVQSIDAAYRPSVFTTEQSVFFPRNERPFINPVSDIVSAMNTPLAPVEMWFTDADDPFESLELSARSSNPTLFSDDGPTITRSGGQLWLAWQPRTNASGAARVTVTVRDPKGSQAETSFLVVVRAFTQVDAGLPALIPSVLEAGDLDHDGDSDLLFTGGPPNAWGLTSDIFLNDGSGNFARRTPVPEFSERNDPGTAWADWDLDGDLDVVGAEVWWHNDGAQFSALAFPRGDRRATTAWGDFDNDGDLDAAVAGGDERRLMILRNEGGIFADQEVSLTPVSEGVAAWGDVDNDGDLDLAVSGRELDSLQAFPWLRLYRNDAGQLHEAFQRIGMFNGHLQWADVNGDGRLDLLMAGHHPDGHRERLWLNLGEWQFHGLELGSTSPGVAPFPGALLADFDNDGDPDLAEFTPTATWMILLNEGNGVFSKRIWASANEPTTQLASADFDGDGNLDLVTGGTSRIGANSNGTLAFHRNHWIRPPNPLTESRATVSSQGVLLEWPDFRDPITGARLTANLRVGRKPGQGDILAPQSLADSGVRQVTGPGNAGFSARRHLRGLAPGSYFWSVQSVDAGWHGSAWAPERSFVVTTAPPPVRLHLEPPSLPFHFAVRIEAPPDFLVLLETSTDLTTWTVHSALRSGTDGQAKVEFSNYDSAAFYRVVALP